VKDVLLIDLTLLMNARNPKQVFKIVSRLFLLVKSNCYTLSRNLVVSVKLVIYMTYIAT